MGSVREGMGSTDCTTSTGLRVVIRTKKESMAVKGVTGRKWKRRRGNTNSI